MKIDVTTITGYEEMSAEDKIKALEEYEMEIPAPKDGEDVTKLKTALSKANAEAADWKRQYREKLTEQERADAERAEQQQKVEEELRTLRRDKTVSGYIANCLALGYSQELAQRAAEAMADGNAAEIMNCQQEFLAAKTKEIEENALSVQPKITTGALPTSTTADLEQENKMRKIMGLPLRTK